MVFLQPDPFLNELTNMFEHSTEKGSVWATFKRSSLKSKVKRNNMATPGEDIEYRCLVRATDGKKTISTSIAGHLNEFDPIDGSNIVFGFWLEGWGQRITNDATIPKARMTALKKRERKDKRKTADAADKKQRGSKQRFSAV